MTRINLSSCRVKLAVLWLSISAIIFIILFIQIILFQQYEGLEKQAVEWFAMMLGSTNTLMVGVLAANALTPVKEIVTVDRAFFFITFGLSIFYLFIIVMCIIVQPIVDIKPIDILEKSKPFLLISQGIVSLALGAFFTSGS